MTHVPSASKVSDMNFGFQVNGYYVTRSRDKAISLSRALAEKGFLVRSTFTTRETYDGAGEVVDRRTGPTDIYTNATHSDIREIREAQKAAALGVNKEIDD